MLTPYDEELNIETRFIDRYRILSVLGRGSMGIVYKARHELMDRLVAIKMLRGQLEVDERSLKRFEREARAASRMDHPNLVAVHDFGLTEQRQPYLIMDYAAGKTLHTIQQQEQILPPERAIHIFSQVCDAMHHAHVQGVIHRDLKPSNIMVITKNDDPDFVKVFDLGVAKIAWGNEEDKAAITNTGEVCGSPVYLSPEQCTLATLDPRTDIYSLGVVMYEMLTGMPPLVGQTVFDTIYMHVHVRPQSCSQARPDLQIPVRLERIVMKALEKNPAERYQSMQELKYELLSALEPGEPNLHVLPPSALRNVRKREAQPKPDEAALERDKATGTMRISSERKEQTFAGTSRKVQAENRQITRPKSAVSAKPAQASKPIPLDTKFVDDHSHRDLLRTTTDKLRAQFNIEISPFSAAVASSIASIIVTAALVFFFSGIMKKPQVETPPATSTPAPAVIAEPEIPKQPLTEQPKQAAPAAGNRQAQRATTARPIKLAHKNPSLPATSAAAGNGNGNGNGNGSFFSIFKMAPNAAPKLPAPTQTASIKPEPQSKEIVRQESNTAPPIAPPPNMVSQGSSSADPESIERRREATALNNEAVSLINDAPSEAIQKLQSALRINPNYTRAKQNLGHAYLNNANKLLENGDTRGAQRNYKLAVGTLQAALGPSHPDTQEAEAAYSEFMNSGR